MRAVGAFSASRRMISVMPWRTSGDESANNSGALRNPIVADTVVEPRPGGVTSSNTGAGVAGVRRPSHVTLALERRHDPAGRAFVETQPGGKRVERRRPAADEGLERVALGQRDVVAADLAPFAHEVGADEVGEGLVEGLDLALKVRICPLHCSW